jgi:hypothetical protein
MRQKPKREEDERKHELKNGTVNKSFVVTVEN